MKKKQSKQKKYQKKRSATAISRKKRPSERKAPAQKKAPTRSPADEHSLPVRLSGLLVSLDSLDRRELPRRIPRGAAYLLYTYDRSGRDTEVFLPEFDPDLCPIPYSEGLEVGVAPDYSTLSKVCLKMGRRMIIENTVMARVEAVFGSPDSFEAEYKRLLYDHDLRPSFPEEVEAEASAAAARPLTEEGRSRPKDPVFTVDGADAKDLDDAVSIAKTEKGYTLGVHIADVSAYVAHGSATMAEAERRTCSTYLPGEVFPMLPRSLSNGACSLNAGEDKYALTVYMEIDSSGIIRSSRLCREIIRSCVRGVYGEVNDIFGRGKDSEFYEKYRKVAESLTHMRELSRILEGAAAARGSVELEIGELSVIPTEAGRPPLIEKRERGEAERMIEQFMLAANRAVAAYCLKNRLPCVYRIHENPDPLKVTDLLTFAETVGINVPRRVEGDRARILSILSQAKEKGLSEKVATPALRAMAKARYDDRCTGHFALALPEYCHFTSPIRRLSDLAVHTVLTRHMEGADVKSSAALVKRLAYAATEGELRAAAAEREAVALWCMLWLSFHVGETFEAAVSSVTRFGLFVTLANGCEGLIPISTLPGYYEFDERALKLKKEGGGASFSIGQSVSVRPEDVSLSARRASFSLCT